MKLSREAAYKYALEKTKGDTAKAAKFADMYFAASHNLEPKTFAGRTMAFKAKDVAPVAKDVKPVGKETPDWVRNELPIFFSDKPKYSPSAVQKEINKDKRIGGKEAKAIHALLKGRAGDGTKAQEAERRRTMCEPCWNNEHKFCKGGECKCASPKHGRKATDASVDAHVGMLGVNTDKAKALQTSLVRNGFTYRFPAQPPTAEMVQHAFVRRNEGGENEWRQLNERKNGFHNITGGNVRRAKDETFRVFDSGEVIDVSNEVKPVGDAAFKPGDKVWANPIGRSGGTVKGTVARINASGQVVIESGGREHEFHPSNVRASDVRPVGDELWTPGHKNTVPAGWLKLSREAMRAAGEAQVAAAKYDRHWPENKALFAALRRMNEAQNKGDEARLLKEAVAVMSEAASKRAGDVRPVGDYAGQQADGALKVLKRTIEGNPHNLSKAHLDVLKARVAKLEAKVAKSKAKDAGDAWSPFSDPDVPPALLKAYTDAFDEAWAEKNSSKKAALRHAAEKAFEACRRAAAVKRGKAWGETADVKLVGDALTTMTNFDYKRGRSKELDAALDAIKRLYEEREGVMEKVKEIERRITAANAVWRKLDRDFEKNK